MLIRFLPVLLILTAPLFAQQPVRLQQVYISGLHINDSLVNAPASVGILKPADLHRNNLTEIATAVNTVPGVLMQSGSVGTNRISIRGIGARTPYGTNKIRAFFGSIPLTSGDSETTIEDIDIENLSQIEIIRGPLSSIYGAGLGGSIILTPNIPEGNSRASVSSTYGSYGLMKTSAQVAVSDFKYGHNIAYHRLQTDGWRENSSYFREGVTFSGEAFRKYDSRLNYLVGYTYLKAYIPSSVNRETYLSDPSAAASNWLAAKGFEQYKTWYGGVGYEWILWGWKNATSIFANWKDSNEPRPFDILQQQTFGIGARTQFRKTLGSGRFSPEVIFGAEVFSDRFSASILENLYQQNNGNGSLEGAKISESSENRFFYNVFAQARMELARRLTLQGSINANQTYFTTKREFPSDEPREPHQYDLILSPQLALVYHLSREQTAYASVSRGFSLPAIAETFTPDGRINPDIKPETGNNLEVGTKLYLLDRRIFLQASAFLMRVENMLVARRIGEDQYVGVNAGSTMHRGVELELKYAQSINWLMISGYASGSLGKFSFDEFIDDGIDYSGNRLTGVPDATASAGFTLGASGFYLSADASFVDRIPLNDAGLAFSDSYRLLHLKAGFRKNFSPLDFHLNAGVNNVFDERYASMILPNAMPTASSSPRYFYPGMPANFYVNLALRWHFRNQRSD